MRFTMTLGLPARAITAGTLLLVGALAPAMGWKLFTLTHVPALGALSLLPLVALLFGLLHAPRAVRVTSTRLAVEHLAWPAFEVPLRDITSVELGPSLQLGRGPLRRFVGNGGVMGFSGLFLLDRTLVRAWVTQLGRPTVLVRRREGRALVLGVDDAAGLVAALRTRH